MLDVRAGWGGGAPANQLDDILHTHHVAQQRAGGLETRAQFQAANGPPPIYPPQGSEMVDATGGIPKNVSDPNVVQVAEPEPM